MDFRTYMIREKCTQTEVRKASKRMNRYLKRNGHKSGHLVSEELRQDKQYQQYRAHLLSCHNELRRLNGSVSNDMKREASKCRQFIVEVKLRFARYGFTQPVLCDGDVMECYLAGKNVDETYNIGCDVNAGYDLEELL